MLQVYIVISIDVFGQSSPLQFVSSHGKRNVIFLCS